MSLLDLAIIVFTLLAMVFGYRAGLIRSLATILGYLIAAPLAVAIAAKFVQPSPVQNAVMLFAALLIFGLLMSALLRHGVAGLIGDDISVFDRIAGALLGAIRIVLLAVLMVLIFERIIPPNREPAWLKESQLRPHLSLAAKWGLRQLPPEAAAYIDRLKRERGIR